MAFEVPLFDVAFSTNADLSSLQYHLVKVTGAVQVGTCSATTDTPVGILQNKPGNAQAAQVRVHGVSKLVADAAITAGNLVCTAANAKGTTVAINGTAAYTIGIALDTVTAQGEVASVLLTHAGRGA